MAARFDERLTLERALLDAPDDRAAWAVYADHLQQAGDPWGERLSLALAAGESTGNRFMQLHDAVVEFDQAKAIAMFGEPLARLLERPGFAATVVLERRFGLIFGARLGRTWVVRGDSPEYQVDREHAEQVLDALLAGKAARLLCSIGLGYCDLERAYSRVAGWELVGNLRRLALGWEIRHVHGTVEAFAQLGKLDDLLDRMPELRELSLAGVTKSFDHPRVERLSLAIDTSQTTLLDALASAELPSLRTLELGCRPVSSPGEGSIAGERIVELFSARRRRRSIAGIEQLELVGWTGARSRGREGLLTRMIRALPGSGVRRLGLRGFSHDDAAADLLLREAGWLDALERIDVEIPGLRRRSINQLRECFGSRLNLIGVEPEA